MVKVSRNCNAQSNNASSAKSTVQKQQKPQTTQKPCQSSNKTSLANSSVQNKKQCVDRSSISKNQSVFTDRSPVSNNQSIFSNSKAPEMNQSSGAFGNQKANCNFNSNNSYSDCFQRSDSGQKQNSCNKKSNACDKNPCSDKKKSNTCARNSNTRGKKSDTCGKKNSCPDKKKSNSCDKNPCSNKKKTDTCNEKSNNNVSCNNTNKNPDSSNQKTNTNNQTSNNQIDNTNNKSNIFNQIPNTGNQNSNTGNTNNNNRNTNTDNVNSNVNNQIPNTGTSTGTGSTPNIGTNTAQRGSGVMNTSVLPQASQTQSLKNHFDQVFPDKNSLENASDKDVNGMYNEYISVDSLVKMYRSTGDTKYIDKANQLTNAYIDTGKDMDGDGYKDWKAKDIPQNMNHDHYEWRAADGVAELQNQIMSDPKLKQQYADEGQKYTQFLEKDVWDKWNNKVGRCGAINKVPSEQHFIARIGKIALNMYNSTGDQKYKNWLDQNVPKLQSAIAKTGDIGATIRGGSMDNGHTADTADFVSECYKSGLYFNKSDMQNLANSARERGLPPGWVKLAQFDPSLYQAYMNKLNSYRTRDGANVTANLAAIAGEGFIS